MLIWTQYNREVRQRKAESRPGRRAGADIQNANMQGRKSWSREDCNYRGQQTFESWPVCSSVILEGLQEGPMALIPTKRQCLGPTDDPHLLPELLMPIELTRSAAQARSVASLQTWPRLQRGATSPASLLLVSLTASFTARLYRPRASIFSAESR